jgi:phosphatidylethanolamine/phosphatidyl-N-methylethanolamine N-methyltransferase
MATHTPFAPRLKWLAFLHEWVKHPLSMASIAPSGKQLANMMVKAMPRHAQHVVELGAGTGAITHALLRHGISPPALLAVEMNPVLYRLLQRRFPEAHVVCGDARHLESMIDSSNAFVDNKVDVICSSLGLLTMPKDLQHDIAGAAFKVLRDDGVFIQYTYGPGNPLADDVRERLGLHYRTAGLAWRNLPPARVYVYSRHAFS